MAYLKINTESAVTAANNIGTINKQIRDEFSSVQAAIKQLDTVWDGSASTKAIEKFGELKNKFSDARYKVLNNYVNFLLQQVGQGYEQTEQANKSLADAFK